MFILKFYAFHMFYLMLFFSKDTRETIKSLGIPQSESQLIYIDKRGGRVLLHAGHQYTLKERYKNGSLLWICNQKRQLRCHGKITVLNGAILKGKSHECPPDFAKNFTDKTLYMCKAQLLEPGSPAVSEVYSSAVESLKKMGVDQEDIPSFSSIKSTLYKYKNQVVESPKKQKVSGLKKRKIVKEEISLKRTDVQKLKEEIVAKENTRAIIEILGIPQSESQLIYIEKNGGKVLLHAGHQYTLKTKLKNGSMKWICTQKKPERCHGKITVLNEVILKGSSHDCPPDFAKNVTDKTLYMWKPHLLSSEVPAVSQVYKSIVESLKNIGVDQEDLPSFDRVKSMLYRYKNRLIGPPKKGRTSKKGRNGLKKRKISSPRKGKLIGTKKEKGMNAETEKSEKQTEEQGMEDVEETYVKKKKEMVFIRQKDDNKVGVKV